MTKEKEIGKITHYFPRINVAVIEAKAELKVGDKIHIKGKEADFEQPVDSMQVEHLAVEKVNAGEAAGMKVLNPVREGDLVYLIAE